MTDSRTIYIAVDPSFAKPNGVAYYIDKDIEYFSIPLNKEDKKLETRDLKNIAITVFNSICKILSLTKKDRVILAVEGQFLGKNAAVFKGLVEIRAFFEGYFLAKFPNTEIITVNPLTWQGSILQAFKINSKEIKQRSIKMASALTKSTPTEDESDAICILQYILNQKGYKK